MKNIPRIRVSQDARNLFVVLFIGLFHGLIYIFLLPAWQHHDEPNHFEYAWLIADRGVLPAEGDYDRSMRFDVAQSMIAQGFFRELGFLPDLDDPERAIWIGPISQLNNPPLYYLIAALPLKLFQAQSIEVQLFVARLTSLGFFLLTLLAAWGIMLELAPERGLIRLVLPLSIAMLPGFVDVMTAVNSDAAAVGLVSLTLWGSVRLIRRGIHGLGLVGTFALAVLCLFTKETAYVAVPLYIIAVTFAFFKNRMQWLPWVLAGTGLVAGLFLVLSSGDAASWYRSTSQEASSRISNPKSVLGEYAFIVKSGAAVTPPFSVPVYQPIPEFPPLKAGDKKYTLGAWIWADEPAKVRTPTLGTGVGLHYELVDVGVEPIFFAFTITVPTTRSTRLWIGINPDYQQKNINVYYDGLVLVEGDLPLDVLPEFDDLDGAGGTWGGVKFENLIRNASAEQGGLRVVSWLDDLGARYLPDQTRPSSILTYLLDWQGVDWHYRTTIARLIRTFWAKFAWGHVSLIGNKPYRLIAVVSAIGIAGFAIWFVRQLINRGKLPWNIVALFAFLLLFVWGGAISRGVIYLGNNRLYLPVARYAYPAIIPTMLILSLGWVEIPGRIMKLLRFPPRIFSLRASIWFGLLFVLDVWSILSIYHYYHG